MRPLRLALLLVSAVFALIVDAQSRERASLSESNDYELALPPHMLLRTAQLGGNLEAQASLHRPPLRAVRSIVHLTPALLAALLPSESDDSRQVSVEANELATSCRRHRRSESTVQSGFISDQIADASAAQLYSGDRLLCVTQVAQPAAVVHTPPRPLLTAKQPLRHHAALDAYHAAAIEAAEIV